MTKVYVSYGSNMDEKQMMERCPDAELIGKGMLQDYELVFRRSCTGFYASIDRCKGSKVPVIVWNINEDDEARLDGYEGYPAWYDKITVCVKLEDDFRKNEKHTNFGTSPRQKEKYAEFKNAFRKGEDIETIEAMTYVLPEDRPMGIPTPAYYNKIERAYMKFDLGIIALKATYVNCLMKNMQDLTGNRFSESEVAILVENLIKTAIPHERRNALMHEKRNAPAHEKNDALIWGAGDYRNMPGEAVYDFVKTPTAIALGFLDFAYRNYEVARKINGIEETILKAMNGCVAFGLRDHGYSADEGFVKLMKVLIKCEADKIAREWREKNLKFFIFMNRSIRHLMELAAEDNETNNNWAGAIDKAEVKEILEAVKDWVEVIELIKQENFKRKQQKNARKR